MTPVISRFVQQSAFVAALVAATGCDPVQEYPDLAGKDIRVTVLHTSDIHSRILPYPHDPLYSEEKLGLVPGRGPYGGIARMAHVIKREREHAGRSLYVDSGDIFQGAPIFNLYRGEAELRALSRAGLDAFALGNHEFDFGPRNVADQFAQWAQFPVLAANYEFERETQPFAREFNILVLPYTVFNLEGLKIGVIGMGNLSSMTNLDDGGNSLGILPLETLQTIQDYVSLLRAEVDVVMMVDHLGLTEDETIARNICGLDVIMGGHHHIALSPPKLIPYDPDPKLQLYDPESADGTNLDGEGLSNSGKRYKLGECPPEEQREVLLAHPNAFAKFVARLDFVVRDRRIRSHKFQLFPIDSTVPEDPKVKYVLEDYIEGMTRELDLQRVMAEATVPLRRFGNDTGDSALGNFVAEAMQFRRYVETDFCLVNSLGLRTDILEGPITLEQVYNVMPFDNTIATMFLNGAEVQELLDYSTARSAERGCSSQVQVSNLTFTMNCRTGKAEDIVIAGKPLSDDGVYELCTSDYLAWGGSGFKMLKRNTTKINTGISLRDAVIHYLRQNPELPLCYDDVDDITACKSGLAIADGRIKTKF